MLDLTLETAIAAPPELAYSVAKEVEKYPTFLPDVKEVVVLERDGARTVTRWIGRVPELGMSVQWEQEEVWDDAQRRSEFHVTKGDWDTYQGWWQFDAQNGHTLLTLHLKAEVRIPLVGPMVHGIVERLARANAVRMLEGLRRHVESVAAGAVA